MVWRGSGGAGDDETRGLIRSVQTNPATAYGLRRRYRGTRSPIMWVSEHGCG